MANRNISTLQGVAAFMAMTIALFTYGFGSASVQALQGAVPDFQLSAARSLVEVVSFVASAKLMASTVLINTEYILTTIYFGILLALYNFGFYGSTTYLPLTEAIGISCLFTLITAVIQAKLIFKRAIHTVQAIAVPVMAVSIVLVIQPAGVFRNQALSALSDKLSSFSNTSIHSLSTNTTSEVSLFDVHPYYIGYTLAVISGISIGLSYDIVAVLLFNVPTHIIVIYTSGSAFLTSIIISLYSEEVVISLTLQQCGLLAVHCVFAPISTFLNVYAVHMLGGATCSIFHSSQVLVMLILQYTLMSNIMPGNHNWIEVFGAIMLLLGIVTSSIVDLLLVISKADVLP